MTDLQKKAEEIYKRMTSYANYSEMNGISKKWFLQKIEEGLQEYHQSELLKLNKSDIISSVCKHEWQKLVNDKFDNTFKCKKCGVIER